MTKYEPTGIELHFVNGHKRTFCQESSELAVRICSGLAGHPFRDTHFIVEQSEQVTVVSGELLQGITVLTAVLPEVYLDLEKDAHSVAIQISEGNYEFKRHCHKFSSAGSNPPILTDVEMLSGEHVYFEFLWLGVGAMGKRFMLHELFARPTLSVRNVEGGFSVWNTAHIVAWSHFPQLETVDVARAQAVTPVNRGFELKIVQAER